jgi:methylmalonyl-CoA mutase
VLIEQARLGNAPLAPGSLLPARPGTLHFEYAALHLQRSEQLQYRYRLRGLDADWSEPGRYRPVTYASLPAGRYVFEVEARLREGGFGASLMAGAFQARVANVREARAKDVARRKIPLTGISDYPLLEEIGAPVAEVEAPKAKAVSDAGLKHFVKALPQAGADALAAALEPIRLAAPFEALRDAAAKADRPPAVFLATLGSLAEFTARADFARNFFAAGGIVSKEPPVPPKTAPELAAAFKASGCRIAVLCSTDKNYEAEAAGAAEALKKAGAQRVWLAGKHEGAGIDTNIFAGADVVHLLKLAQAELGVAQ